jgi:putative hemolysin
MIITIKILAALFFIIASAYFSGLETGIYRLSKVRLRLGKERKPKPYIFLDSLIRDEKALIFTTLIANNIVNYGVTSIVTGLFLLAENTHAAEAYTTAIVTPTLFVFAEVIPKNTFFYRANTLMPKLSFGLWLCHKTLVTTGIVGALKTISDFFTRIAGSKMPVDSAMIVSEKHYIRRLARETHEEGLLTTTQTGIINRLINISNTTVTSVMVPIEQVEMVNVKTSREDLRKELQKTDFRKLPVYRGSKRDIIGYIDIYETLNQQDDFTDLESFIKPVAKLPAETGLVEAITTMRDQNLRIILVTSSTHSKTRVVGFLTTKDVVEQLTGELV